MSNPDEQKVQSFFVEWTINIDAKSPEEAAKKALEIMRNPDSRATYFAVTDENGEPYSVDLEEIQN